MNIKHKKSNITFEKVKGKRFTKATILILALLGMTSTTIHADEKNKDNDESLKSIFCEHISIGAAIELESEWGKDYNNETYSSFSLATLEFDVQAKLIDWAKGEVIFGWEDDENKFMVDESFLTIGYNKYPFVQIGRYDLPFGVYEGNTISDPLTKEAFEAKEDALMLGLILNNFYSNIYVFDSEADVNDSEQFGGNIRYETNVDHIRFDSGIGLISSIFDADTFSETPTLRAITGLAAHAQLGIDGFGIFTEYITALETIDTYRPKAWQLELSYSVDILEKDTFFSLCYSHTDYLEGLLPKIRIAATSSIEFFDSITLALEYAFDKDYRTNENSFNGTDPTNGDASVITLQLAYEF